MKRICSTQKRFKNRELVISDKISGELTATGFMDLFNAYQEDQEVKVIIKCEKDGYTLEGRVFITALELKENKK